MSERREPEKYVWKEMPGSSHDVLRRTIGRMPPARRLLDLGAAGGHLGRAVRAQLRVSWRASSPTRRLPTSARDGYDEWRATDALSAGPVERPVRRRRVRRRARASAGARAPARVDRAVARAGRDAARLASERGQCDGARRARGGEIPLRGPRDPGSHPPAVLHPGDRPSSCSRTRASGPADRADVDAATSSPSRRSAARPGAGRARARVRERPASADPLRLPVRLRGDPVRRPMTGDRAALLVCPPTTSAAASSPALRTIAEWRRGAAGRLGLGGHPRRRRLPDGTARRRGARRGGGRPAADRPARTRRTAGKAPRSGPACSRRTRDPILVSDVDLSTPLTEWVKPRRAASDASGRDRLARPRARSRAARASPSIASILGRAGNVLVRLFAVPGIHDTQCGFKLFRGDVARRLFGRARIDRFAYDMEILFLARRAGIAIAEVPVLWFNSAGLARLVRARLARHAAGSAADPLDSPERLSRSRAEPRQPERERRPPRAARAPPPCARRPCGPASRGRGRPDAGRNA